VKEQEEKLRQQLADMRAKEAETGSDIPGLIQERDECRWVWGFASFSSGFREERELRWKAPGTVQQKPSFTSGRRRGLSCPTACCSPAALRPLAARLALSACVWEVCKAAYQKIQGLYAGPVLTLAPPACLPACLPPSASLHREVCKAAYQKIQDLRADLDAQWAAYKENNALFRVQLAEDRAKRQEEYLKLKAERDAERAGGRLGG
jgi:hypothetical protein